MEQLTFQLRQDCTNAFNILKQQLLSGEHFVRQPPVVQLQFVDNGSLNASVSVDFDDNLILSIDDTLLLQLFTHIDTQRDAIFSLSDLDSDDELMQQLILEQVYNFALYFVLLHEVYHLLGGHLGYICARGRGSRLSEEDVSQAEQKYDIKQLLAFYFEFEANAHALITLVNDLNFGDIERLLLTSKVSKEKIPESPVLMELSGPGRTEAFKLLLCANWMVIVLLEAQQKTSVNHPAPPSRLLAITSTMLAWYCELDEITVNEQGAMTQEVDEPIIDTIEHFLFHVARPVIVNMWSFPDLETSQRIGFSDGIEVAGA